MSQLFDHPVANVQWVPREKLQANSYNPNHVAPPELRLLKISLLEDGWTQPIVVRPEGDHHEIVDGYHRWLVSADTKIAAMTDGLVPIVVLRASTPAQQRMATIRHNRARGTHYVVKMADIVSTLVNEYGLDAKEVEKRLQMDAEEVDRLLDHGDMRKRGAAAEFSKGWEPV